MMLSEPKLNRFLSNTTALVRTGLLTSLFVGYTGQVVQATGDIITDITTPQTSTHYLQTLETLTITSIGSISASPVAVLGSGQNATKVDNRSSVQGTFGVLLDTGTTLGELTNSGTIEGNNDAVHVYDSNLGTLTNDTSGIIDGGNYGVSINVLGRIDTLTNSGEIKANYAIGLDASSIGDLTNESDGVIDGGGAGLRLFSASDIDTVTNRGEIDAYTAIDLNASSIGDLTNESGGVIHGDGVGLQLVNVSDIDTLTNSGEISGANAITLSNSSIQTLINNTGGTISSTSSIGIQLTGSTIDELTNKAGGTISGNGFGLLVVSGSEVGTVDNQGTITAGTGILVSGSEITGGVTNTGTIEGTGGTAINLQSLVSDVTLNLNGGSVLGDIVEDDPTSGFSHVVIGGDFATDGDIYVSDIKISHGKKFTISAGDRVTVQNMKNSAGGTLSFGVTDKDTVGFIDVVGAGEGINLTGMLVTASAETASLEAGDEIHIGSGQVAVIGMAGNTGQEATEIEDTSVLWDFVLVDGSQALVTGSIDSTDLYFVVKKGMDLNDAADGPNNKNAAKVLDTLSSSNNPELQQIWTALNGAETEAEINQILEATQSDVSGGGVSAANLNANASFDITGNRLLSVRANNVAGSGISSGDLTEGVQLWVQAFGQVGEQSERDSVSGFDLTSYGFVAGMDTEKLVDDAVIGAAFGYGSSFVESDGASAAETDINSYQLTLYADYALPNQMFVNGMVAYAYHDNETRRIPAAGLAAEADYAAHQYVARLEMGRDFTVGDFTLSPSGLAQVSHYNPDGYTETGAGGANLTVEQDATNVAELGAGLDVTWAYQPTSGGLLETTIGAQYRYDFIGEAVSTTSSFAGGGSAVQSDGFDPAQSTVDLGVGVRYQMNDSWELAAQYDFEYKDDYRAHIGSVRAAYSF